MPEVRREDPPAHRAQVTSTEWAPIIETLMANPGVWFRVGNEFGGRVAANNLKRGNVGGAVGDKATTEGSFETRTQNIDGDEKRIKVWAKWTPNA